jgi:hypothetical protein
MMKAQWLSAALMLAAACGGPDDLAYQEDAIINGDFEGGGGDTGGSTANTGCSGTLSDDVSNTSACAALIFSTALPDPLRLTSGDIDWFYFKSPSSTEKRRIWTDGIASARCRLYRKDSSGSLVLEVYASPCNWEKDLQPNTYYFMKVEPNTTGTYDIFTTAYKRGEDTNPRNDIITCLSCAALYGG